MGDEEIAATRLHLGWTSPPFEIPADIRAAWDMREKGARAEQEWRARFAAYKASFPRSRPNSSGAWPATCRGGFDDLRRAYVDQAQAEGKALATRQSSQATLECDRPVAAGTARRIGGPHALERHPAQGFRRRSPRQAPARQLPAFRRARIRHVGHAERHRLARRVHSRMAARS